MRPVVVEFKRTASGIAIGQALVYLEWVLAHRDDGNDFDAADLHAFARQAMPTPAVDSKQGERLAFR